jgi:hypothetical protein
MQNKPNFRKAKMNLNFYPTKDYEKTGLSDKGKTNPIQTQSNPIQTQSKPIQSQYKPNQTQPVVSLSNLFQIDDFLGIFHLATAVFYLKF